MSVSLDTLDGVVADNVRGVFDRYYTLEESIMAREAEALVPKLHADLRARLAEIFAELFPEDESAVAEACIDVLAEDEKSSAAAATHGVAVRTVYRRTERLKARAITDTTTRALLTEIYTRRGDFQ